MRRLLRFLYWETRAWNDLRGQMGLRPATVARLRALLDLDAGFERAMAPVREGLERLDRWVEEASEAGAAVAAATTTEALLAAEAVARSGEELEGLRGSMREMALGNQPADVAARVLAFTTWIENVEVEPGPLVSVVLPTYDRAGRVRRAIDSVLAQSYPHLELIVVDDGSTDTTPDVLAQVGDPRVTLLRIDHSGVGAARNLALEKCRGDVVAYIDDDNLMCRHWLKSVVWAFQHHPEIEVLYGARVVETLRPDAWGDLPWVHLQPYDRWQLEKCNYIDMNTLTHRSGLAEAVFDDTLRGCSDWELVLRLTALRAPLALPVVACTYSTDAPHRISADPMAFVDGRAVARRARSTRPPRVLAYNALFPLISETYIEEEIEGLAAEGADVAYCTHAPSAAPMVVAHPVFSDLKTAVDQFHPDVVVLHWANFAAHAGGHVAALELPFAVRVHSFDFDPAVVAGLVEHPSCVGVWAYPHLAERVPGTLALPAYFGRAGQLPPPAEARDLVLSVSAGLPKKDWPLLLDAFSRLSDVETRIVVGTTNDFEDEPAKLVRAVKERAGRTLVQVNLTRSQVFELLGRTALLVYSLQPGKPVGNPMSVAEGLCAGASVVVPDVPDMDRVAGPGARRYRHADDIVAHAREVLAGGPAVEEERRINREYGLATYAAPETPARFFSELQERVDAWWASRS